MRKWTYEIIVVAVLLAIGLGVWYGFATKDERAEKAELERLVNFAQRQALEIAIIEQASKLSGYKQQMAAAQQQVQKQNPLTTPIAPPIVANPTDVNR